MRPAEIKPGGDDCGSGDSKDDFFASTTRLSFKICAAKGEGRRGADNGARCGRSWAAFENIVVTRAGERFFGRRNLFDLTRRCGRARRPAGGCRRRSRKNRPGVTATGENLRSEE